MKTLQEMFSQDIKAKNIKPLPDKELHRLLKVAKYSPNKKERTNAKNKIVLHILPIIISKCKKYFPIDYLVTNTDFIQEVILEILDNAIKNFDIDRQEEGRCALFLNYVNYYFLVAYYKVKKKYLGSKDVKYKEIFNKDLKDYFNFKPSSLYNTKIDGIILHDEDADFDYDNNLINYLESIFSYDYNYEKDIFIKEIISKIYKHVLPNLSLFENIIIIAGWNIYEHLSSNIEDFIKILGIKREKLIRPRTYLLKVKVNKILKELGVDLSLDNI